MEQPSHQPANRREVQLRLKPDELVPQDGQADFWRNTLSEYDDRQRAHFFVGVLKASIEGAVQGIDQDEPLGVVHSLRLGVAAITAYSQLASEEQGRSASEPPPA